MSDAPADPELITLKDMTVLKLEPGDIVVLKHPRVLSAEAMERIGSSWKRVMERRGLAGAVSVVVHQEGMDVGVIRSGLVTSDRYGDCTRMQQVTTDPKGDPMVDDKRDERDPVRNPPRDGDGDGKRNEDDREPVKQPIGPGGSPMEPSPPKK